MKTLIATALAGLICAGTTLRAETPPPFPDFSAKRVAPPKAGARKRITVQITPEDLRRQAAPVTKAEPAAAVAPLTPGRYTWFWTAVSPEIAASGPGRLQAALQQISNPPDGAGVAAPRLQTLQEIAEAQGIEILKATIGTRISPALVLAVIAVESGGRSDAVSGAGAEGLMQLMPGTAARFGVTDSFAPAENIRGGVRYLDFLMQEFDNDPILALAGYNAGENAVRSHDGVPPFAETRDYVPKVLAAFRVARGLCLTPPELVTDGCVFAVTAS